MTRRVDPKSVGGFAVKARGESEKKVIHDLKTLAFQDGVEISDLIFEGIEYMFKVHHWPPGNPQLTLETSLLPKQQLTPHCKCGKVAVRHGVHVASGIERFFCAKCFSEVPGRYDVKVWQLKGEL